MAQMVKSLPAIRETQVWSLGREDPLEKWMANHSSILAWRIPSTEESGGLQFMGTQATNTRMNKIILACLSHCCEVTSCLQLWIPESLPLLLSLSYFYYL